MRLVPCLTILSLSTVFTGFRPLVQSPSETDLARARQAYEQAMEGVRDEVEALLRSGSGAPEQRMDLLERFRTDGTWPTTSGSRALERRRDKIEADLVAAYKRCFGEAFGANDPIAKTVRAEMEQWQALKGRDTAAWIDVKTADSADPVHIEASAAFELPIELTATYRLEIEGAVDGPESPHLLVPVPAGGCVPIDTRVDGGRFHVLVTVGPKGLVACDLGLVRSADFDKVETVEGERASLVAGSAVTLDTVRWKALTLSEAAEPAPTVSEAVAPAAKPREAEKKKTRVDVMPVGTTLSGTRTRSNGKIQPLSGEVVTNTGKRLVIRIQDFHEWDYIFEWKGDDRLELVDQAKRDKSAGTLSNMSGSFTITEDALVGNYAWTLAGQAGPEQVSGTIELKRTSGSKQGPDDQLKFWPVGARVTGSREADVDVSLEGTVRRSDEERLEIEFTESWQKNGRPARPKVLWVYERVSRDPKSGKVTLRNVAQTHIGGGVVRSAVQGDVVIDDTTLRGAYQFDYQVPGQELQKDPRRAVEMKVER